MCCVDEKILTIVSQCPLRRRARNRFIFQETEAADLLAAWNDTKY
jgi:hypothetical protein|tara:strand:- start:24443 stop:24577 length:135 start_codon:yes stop_codon:yes gene_type:complete